MMVFLAHFFVAAMVGVLIDALWVAGIAKGFYQDKMYGLLAERPNPLPIVIFYFIYIWSILYFVVEPALLNHDFTWLLKHAAFLGLAMYATYDLTNASTLKNWSVKLTVVDIIWGTFLTTVVAAATFLIFNQ
jgi:uncharacterized membrane protein